VSICNCKPPSEPAEQGSALSTELRGHTPTSRAGRRCASNVINWRYGRANLGQS